MKKKNSFKFRQEGSCYIYELNNREEYTIRVEDGVVKLDRWAPGLDKRATTIHDTGEQAYLMFCDKLDAEEITELVMHGGVKLFPKL